MKEMSARNKEMLTAVLSGASKPKDVAKAHGVDVNKVYKLTHNHREKLKRAEAKTRRLREADKRKKEAKKQATAIVKKPDAWENRYVWPNNAEELQKIAIAARKLHMTTIYPPPKALTQLEDYFERLKMAQAEIDRLVAESVKQRNEIDELKHQNKTLMRVLYRIGHL